MLILAVAVFILLLLCIQPEQLGHDLNDWIFWTSLRGIYFHVNLSGGSKFFISHLVWFLQRIALDFSFSSLKLQVILLNYQDSWIAPTQGSRKRTKRINRVAMYRQKPNLAILLRISSNLIFWAYTRVIQYIVVFYLPFAYFNFSPVILFKIVDHGWDNKITDACD